MDSPFYGLLEAEIILKQINNIVILLIRCSKATMGRSLKEIGSIGQVHKFYPIENI